MTRQQHRREEQETVKTKKITDRVEERIRQVNERERDGRVYLRVSSEAQDGDDKVSIPEQLADIEQYAKQNNIRINRVFQDIAPGSSKYRPDFQRMLSEIRNGKVHVLLCWKADRLARGVHPASALLEALEGRCGTRCDTRDHRQKLFCLDGSFRGNRTRKFEGAFKDGQAGQS